MRFDPLPLRAKPPPSLLVHGLLCVLVASVLGLVLNWPTVAREWGLAAGLAAHVRCVGFPALLSLTWVLALSPSRILTYSLLPLVTLVGGLYAFYTREMNLLLSPHLFSGLFHSNWDEVGQFISLRVAVWLALVLATTLGGAYLIHLRRPRRWASRLGLAAVGLVAYVVIVSFAKPHFARNVRYFPFNAQRTFAQYLDIQHGVRASLEKKRDVGEAFAYTLRRPLADDLVVLVVLGESARADHFSLNGYPRLTNPELAQLPNVLSFRDIWSCAGVTGTSVPCMLTRATEAHLEVSAQETSFISVFKHLGFQTAFVSGDRRAFEYTIPISAIAFESGQVSFREENDATLRELGVTPPCDANCDAYHWPVVSKILRENTGRRTLVLMHTHGSHLDYHFRYPREFARFTPECKEPVDNIRACDLAHVANAYDNTILFTDHLLREMARSLEDRNALILYVSDHGQHLGERGLYFHGYLVSDHTTPELRRVPLIAWGSDRFVRENREAWEVLRRNTGVAGSHDNLFHSLLDCLGIESPAIDRSLSLCSPTLRPRETPPAAP